MNEAQQKLIYQIASTMIPGVGDIVGKKLIDYCGGPEAIFREKKSNLSKIQGIPKRVLDGISDKSIQERAEKELKFIEKYKIKTIYFTDKIYPERLKQCADSPLMLYFKGNADLNCPKIVSIVGTRNASQYGKDLTKSIVEKLSSYNILVVSGLAYGIDTQAHKNALSSKLKTVAVLAHGLDRIYPVANKALAEQMIHQGGLLTEFLTQSNPDRENFPKRNRIVAGLSDAVIVIESALKGGALITAGIANSYNRDVFALPGRINDKFSQGCNFLIKTNRAALIQSADDLIYMMGWMERAKAKPIQKKLFVKLTDEEKKIVDLLNANETVGIDKIWRNGQIGWFF
jgi:DNA processing protein